MDLFLLSSGVGFQNRSLEPEIELNTARTNVEGFIRMVKMCIRDSICPATNRPECFGRCQSTDESRQKEKGRTVWHNEEIQNVQVGRRIETKLQLRRLLP